MGTEAATWICHRRLAACVCRFLWSLQSCSWPFSVSLPRLLCADLSCSHPAGGRLRPGSPCASDTGVQQKQPYWGNLQPFPVLWVFHWLKITSACCCHGDWSYDSILQCCVPMVPKPVYFSVGERTFMLRRQLILFLLPLPTPPAPPLQKSTLPRQLSVGSWLFTA